MYILAGKPSILPIAPKILQTLASARRMPKLKDFDLSLENQNAIKLSILLQALIEPRVLLNLRVFIARII